MEAVFPKNAQYIALGHIHKPQIVPGTKINEQDMQGHQYIIIKRKLILRKSVFL